MKKKARTKEQNASTLLKIIRDYGPISLNEIKKKSLLSKPTVLSFLEFFKKKEYIEEAGKQNSNGGRRALLYALKNDACYFIGIFFEIPSITTVLIDIAGCTLASKKCSFNMNCDVNTVLSLLVDSIDSIYSFLPKEKQYKIRGIGVALSGFFDKTNAVSLSTPRLPYWKDVPIGSFLQQKYTLPVILINDSDALLLTELEKNDAQYISNAMLIVAQYGIGASLWVENKLITGRFGNAGSLSHIIVVPDGELCVCGHRGCLERYVSEQAIIAQLQKLKAVSVSSSKYTIEDFYTLVAENDADALAIIDSITDLLSHVIAQLITILEINHIFLAGFLVKLGPYFSSALEKKIRSKLLNILSQDLLFEYTHFDNSHVVAEGSVLPLKKQFFDLLLE